jgi:hypothetical protein
MSTSICVTIICQAHCCADTELDAAWSCLRVAIKNVLTLDSYILYCEQAAQRLHGRHVRTEEPEVELVVLSDQIEHRS